MEQMKSVQHEASQNMDQTQMEIAMVRNSLIRTEKGSIANSIQNCKIALENDPLLKNSIRKNLLTGQTDLILPVDWKRSGRMLTDTDQKNIELRLESLYCLTSEKKIAKAISIVANENQYHPIRDYLNSLVWDGTPRIRFALHHFLGAEISDFNEECLRIFMLGAAQRVFQPGCKFELMLCLVGGQGAGKSSFFRLLSVKDEWFSDDLKKLDDENVYRKLQGHWIIEMSEMIATANARSIEEIKSFLSRQKETYKVPYEVHPEDRLRQCIFAGTTNRMDFLPRDRSGNRRFLPVQVYPEQAEQHPLADEAASREYIDQMWAEIMNQFRSGQYSLRLSSQSEKLLCVNQKDFMQEDTKAGVIYAFIQDFQGDFLCSKLLYSQAFKKSNEPEDWETREIREIVNTGIANGELSGWQQFKSPRRFPGYGTQRGWERIPVNRDAVSPVNSRQTKQISFMPVHDVPDLPWGKEGSVDTLR